MLQFYKDQHQETKTKTEDDRKNFISVVSKLQLFNNIMHWNILIYPISVYSVNSYLLCKYIFLTSRLSYSLMGVVEGVPTLRCEKNLKSNPRLQRT